MSAKKPATSQHRFLLSKLEALAERGINGEKKAAKTKIRRLKARYDFTKPVPQNEKDIFAGIFYKATAALPILKLSDFETLNAIKWAIEQSTGIICIFKHDQLLANAMPASAKSISIIAGTVAKNFDSLWTQYQSATKNPSDKKLFIRGLFDGMMNDIKLAGEPLPSRTEPKRKLRIKRKAIAPAPGIAVHPYSVAIKLGRQIRFQVPLDEIGKELENSLPKQIQ